VNKSLRGIALAASGFSALLAASLIVRAQDTPAAEPAKHSTIRLEQPYSKIPDLTDDEKSKIEAIHKTALEQIKTVHDKEAADIRALLTDEQKTELDKLVNDKRAAAQEKSKAKKSASTEPAAG
jgi:Spy/CpxP family protein refolding chaperone